MTGRRRVQLLPVWLCAVLAVLGSRVGGDRVFGIYVDVGGVNW